jgi:redox-sensitive bicupin YhaK (pirin superfamily)
MFGAILLAVNLKGAFNQSANLFALSYLAIRVILLLLYLRVHITLPEVRPVAALFLIGFGIGQTIWIASLFIPTPAKYFIWIVSLFSEFATPWVGNRMLSQVSVHSTHLPERLGLFTLIVLGELIIAVVSGVSGVLWTTPAAVKAVIAFTSAVLIWVYYFDFYQECTHHIQLGSGQLHIYGHLIVYIGLVTYAAGVKEAILHQQWNWVTIVLLAAGLFEFFAPLMFIKFRIKAMKGKTMFNIIPAEKRFYIDRDWLKTYWLFSFDEYYDLSNLQFGVLRVFNDDTVGPGNGFPMHQHRNMEIVTILLEGELTHQDSTGIEGTIREGDVQRMTAGTGVTHSEFNTGKIPTHLYQIWIIPESSGLEPSYEQRHYESSDWKNKLLPIASNQEELDAIPIHSDATIYRADFDRNHSQKFTYEAPRRVFIYLTNGILKINDNLLRTGDQARIEGESELNIIALEETQFILIDLAD